MQLEEGLKKVAVIGAAGKMGSGITFLMLVKMIEQELLDVGTVGSGAYRMKAIDLSENALFGLKQYLRKQLVRYAEKNINDLRKGFASQPKLISNEEIIEAFVNGALDSIDFSTSIEDAKGFSLIFEAALENEHEKIKIFQKLHDSAKFFFTNTSSIPIHMLSEKGDLKGRLIGFHFYNPPAVQKLVEIIPGPASKTLVKMADQLARQLHKTVVYSADVAGFIGNGYFAREILQACQLVREFSKKESFEVSLQKVDTITRDFLLRPMGIFQLLDYVGIDVAQNILKIMRHYLKDPLIKEALIAEWLELGIKGGQTSDGSQKNGIFEYNKGVPVAVFDKSKKSYVPLTKNLELRDVPLEYTWRELQSDSLKMEKIKNYFQLLKKKSSFGAKHAISYGRQVKEIAEGLIKDKVAKSLPDVDEVLKKGFYHLYGPGEVDFG